MTADDLQNYHKLLKSAGLRITGTRVGILKLCQEQHGPHTIEFFQTSLKSMGKKYASDYTTIYRCLVKMADVGLLNEIVMSDGIRRFEIAHTDEHKDHHHHHIICKSCKVIKPIDHCGLNLLEELVKHMGYSKVEHRLEFFGLCQTCK